MASIQKHGSKFYITVSMGFDVNGKRLRYTITYQPEPTLSQIKQKKALEKYAAEFDEKVVNGVSMDGNKIAFKDFAEKWLDNVAKDPWRKAHILSINIIWIPKFTHVWAISAWT